MLKSLIEKQRHDIQNIGKLGKLSESDLKRIISKVEWETEEFDNSKCWIWDGTMMDNKKGHCHGSIWYNKKYVMTHRIMYHNYISDVPEYTNSSLKVLHKCDHSQNGRCINPWHMELGTNKENSQDALKSNTLTLIEKGESNPMSKLSDKQIKEIMVLKSSGLSQKEVASKYGIHQSQVSRYWNKKTRVL